jgi:hypothetical protein
MEYQHNLHLHSTAVSLARSKQCSAVHWSRHFLFITCNFTPGKLKLRWQDNIKIDIHEIGWRGVDCIQLAHWKHQGQAVVHKVMNHQVPQNVGNLFHLPSNSLTYRQIQLQGVKRQHPLTFVSGWVIIRQTFSIILRTLVGICLNFMMLPKESYCPYTTHQLYQHVFLV